MSNKTQSIIIIGVALGSLVLLITLLGTVIMLFDYTPVERTPHETTAQSYERIKPIHSEPKVYRKQAKPIHHYQAPTQEASKPKPQTCPEGTRPTGGGGCKIEPTGCYLDENTPMSECK